MPSEDESEYSLLGIVALIIQGVMGFLPCISRATDCTEQKAFTLGQDFIHLTLIGIGCATVISYRGTLVERIHFLIEIESRKTGFPIHRPLAVNVPPMDNGNGLVYDSVSEGHIALNPDSTFFSELQAV